MGRLFKIIAGILAIGVGSSYALNYSWLDWNYCDANWWYSRAYPSPWQSVVEGVSLDNKSCAEHQKDWELYDRMLDSKDGTNLDSPPPPYPPVLPTTPAGSRWFALYSRKTGILRTFQYFTSSATITGYKQGLSLDLVTSGGGAVANNSYFLYEGGGKLIGYNERGSAAPPAYMIPMTRTEKWVVSETYLSYDPVHYRSTSTYSATPVYFQYQLRTYQKTTVNLSGTLKVLNPETSGSFSAGLIGSAGNFAQNAFQGVSKAVAGPENAAKSIDEMGSWLITNGPASSITAGLQLKNLASGLATASTGYLGIAMGATSLISSFLGADFTSSKVSYPSYVINLGGFFETVESRALIQVPLASSYLNSDRKSIYSSHYTNKEEQNLGLFYLTERPKARLHYVRRLAWSGTPYTSFRVLFDRYINIDDINCLVRVNPTSGAKLREIKVWVTGISANMTETKNGGQGLAPPPAYSLAEPVNPITNNLRYAGRLGKDGVGEYVDYPYINQPTRYLPNGGVGLKVMFKFETSAGKFMHVVKEVGAQTTNTIAPIQPIPIPGISPLPNPQQPLPANLASAHTSCGLVPDPVRNLFVGFSELLPGSPYYGGDANWYVRQGGPAEIGSVPYAVSGYVGNNGSSSLFYKFTGDVVHFDWKVSSENSRDLLQVYIDGAWHAQITGESQWANWWSRELPWGNHTVEIRYSKNGSLARGEDRGYVANLFGGPH